MQVPELRDAGEIGIEMSRISRTLSYHGSDLTHHQLSLIISISLLSPSDNHQLGNPSSPSSRTPQSPSPPSKSGAAEIPLSLSHSLSQHVKPTKYPSQTPIFPHKRLFSLSPHTSCSTRPCQQRTKAPPQPQKPRLPTPPAAPR